MAEADDAVVGASEAESWAIVWKDDLSESREVSRASARLFICGQRAVSMEARRDVRRATCLANSVASRDQLAMVIVHQGLPLAVKFAYLCDDTSLCQRNTQIESKKWASNSPLIRSVSRLSSSGSDAVDASVWK